MDSKKPIGDGESADNAFDVAGPSRTDMGVTETTAFRR